MKHTINTYESPTLHFHDTVEISRAKGDTRVEIVTIFSGDRGTNVERVAVHLSDKQALALATDLINHVNNKEVS